MTDTLFASDVPLVTNAADAAPGLNLGTRITFGVSGNITGVRWRFPDTLPSGTINFRIDKYDLSNDATSFGNLATGSFTAPVAGAYVTQAITPVAVLAGDQIVVWINTPDRYVASAHYFDSAVVRGSLTGFADDAVTPRHNGRFVSATTVATWPASGFNASGYHVDVVFTPPGVTVAIGQAVETDTATAFTHAKTRPIGQAIETDTATTFGRIKTRLLGQAVETDTATAFTHAKTRPIGQAVETDTAQPMTLVRTAGFLHPTSEQVGVAWLKALGLPAGAVATTLPAPAANGSISWASTGFVQVAGVGGSNEPDYKLRHPVLGITCWAVSTGSSKPPWGRANQLAEQVIAAVYSGSNWRLTNLPPAYKRAHVQNVRASEPRRLPDDGGGYARYTFDLYLDWIEVP